VAGQRISDCFRVSVSGFRISIALLIPLLSTSLVAQTPLSNLVYTVGTTIRDNSNQDWSYVLLDTPDPQIIAGKRFAVYGKAGYPTNGGIFTLRGNLVQQTDIATINTKLNQSVVLGQNLVSLNDALATAVGTNVVGLLRSVPGITNQTLPQKVLTAFQMATTDVSIAQMLALLEQGNPGLTICAGHAFSEAVGTVTTYEVRELDLVTSVAGNVVGRVTLVPNAAVILPAPGKPFQVASNQISEHLQIRLRWGTPPELRRLSVLNVGFNLWRIPRGVAETANFQVTPPTPAQLHADANFVRANRSTVFATMDYTTGSGAGAADDSADRITFFFSDSGRGSGYPPFNDGEEFYYFVTARDLLGRDGLVSAGGLARACRRLPPKQPTNVRVVNTVLPGTTNQPRLEVTWLQNTNAADLVTHYWIYRWPNPTMAFTNDAAPLDYRIGVVASIPGANLNTFIDTGAGAMTTPNLSNVWFTVRAVSVAACDPLLSPHAGPAWGVLRQRDAPAAATGSVVGSCGTPVVMFQNFAANGISADAQNWHFRLTCVRRDPGIAWVQFTITNLASVVETIGPVYFPPDGNTAQIDYLQPASNTNQAGQLMVGCIVGTFYDQVSQPASCVITTPFPFTQQSDAVFFAGQLLSTALSSSDPLLSVANGGQSFCVSPYSVVPDASGMVAIYFDTALVSGTVVLIQALTNNTWYDVAVVSPDANNVYWVSYPGCLIGPLPSFRGCRVNLPADAGCDQHVARASDSGAVAPLRVRFRLTPRTREYRVYRRADGGPLTLVAQGAGAYDPSKTNKIIEVRDDAMPPSPTRLCYFVQLLDEHGSGSPLSFIGCKEVKPATLPRPVLSEPQAIGTANSPQVALNWFCPTSGVARFQFKISLVDAPAPSTPSGFASLLLTPFPSYNKTASYLGLVKSKLLLLFVFSEAHLTSRIGAGFGPGPQLTISANVTPNATYAISVAAVGDQGNVGNASEVWQFTWKPPVQLATVPWPARPLAPVQDFNVSGPGVAAILLTDENFQQDQRYPVGVRIGQMNRNAQELSVYSNAHSTNYASYDVLLSSLNPDPNTQVFHRTSSGELLLPIVVYRQQVTNATFPRVSGDLTQVSPLIERVPWKMFTFRLSRTVTIPDRLFAISYENIDDSGYHPLSLRDQQPVLAGARYRYTVVRFDAKREPVEVIPAGEVEIPQIP
jgi:hypothetical protein